MTTLSKEERAELLEQVQKVLVVPDTVSDAELILAAQAALAITKSVAEVEGKNNV